MKIKSRLTGEYIDKPKITFIESLEPLSEILSNKKETISHLDILIKRWDFDIKIITDIFIYCDNSFELADEYLEILDGEDGCLESAKEIFDSRYGI